MISVQDFWREFAGRRFWLSPVPGLPDSLALVSQWDQLFGGLTRHRVESLERHSGTVLCQSCPYARGPRTDVCETHMGVLAGQLGRWLQTRFEPRRVVQGGDCRLHFEPEEAGS